MFAVKRRVLEALFNNAEWSRRLENAKTMREVELVLQEFVREKSWKVRAYAKQTM